MEARPVDAEVLIVGGGPAGCAAALGCVRHGLRTILLERDVQARGKPGEGLHPGIEPLLHDLDAADLLHEATRARFAGVEVAWGDAPRFEAFGQDERGPWLGFQVQRSALDEALRRRAQERGVEVRVGVAALGVIKDDDGVAGVRLGHGGSLRSRLLIDASGPARWLGRRLGLQDRHCSPRQSVRYGYVRGRCPDRDATPALLGDATGWTWTARVDSGLYQWARLDFEPVGRAHDWLPQAFAGMARVGASRGADATWRVTPAAGAGWLIAGDAAANLDPTSSKGVLKALLSGTMAARTAAAILRRGADAAQGARAYRAWMDGWFDSEVAALAPMYARLGASGYGRRRTPDLDRAT